MKRYVYNRKLEDEVLEKVSRSERPWHTQNILSLTEKALRNNALPCARLGNWGLLTSSRQHISHNMLAAMAATLRQAMLVGMESNGLSLLAVCQDGRRPVLYKRIDRQTLALMGSSEAESWSRGTRVVHTASDGEILRMVDIR